MSDAPRRVDGIEEFLKLVVDSYLVESRVLEGLFQSFKNDVRRSSRFGNTITGLSSYLISKGVLTSWQVDKLREGKYKGFYYFEYRLLDLLSLSPTGAVYLAERKTTPQLVSIEIHPAQGGKEVPPQVIQEYER